MIYDGAYEPTTIEQWLEDKIQWKSQNGELRALNDDLFKFSRKYLLVNTYEEFTKIRSKEVLKEKIQNKKFKLTFIRNLFITKGDLAFEEDSYQYSAVISFFSFLPRIINRIESSKNRYYGRDDTYLEYAHKDFYHNCSFIDEKTFYIIKKYASIYFEWIKEQLKSNKKLKIKETIRNF